MKKEYTEQAALLIETIPFIAKESCFALKGGTAINLFYRDMPRLSIDSTGSQPKSRRRIWLCRNKDSFMA